MNYDTCLKCKHLKVQRTGFLTCMYKPDAGIVMVVQAEPDKYNETLQMHYPENISVKVFKKEPEDYCRLEHTVLEDQTNYYNNASDILKLWLQQFILANGKIEPKREAVTYFDL